MLKKLVAFVIISLLFMNFAIPGAKAADSFVVDQFPYKEMQIQVMPEFDYPEKWPEDQPSLLVGYYGTFTNKTGKDFNGEIEFPVPANDKNFEMYLLAEFPSEDEPEIQRPFEVNKEKGVITWKPSKAIAKDKTYRFVVEYYINPFEVVDGKKKFAFNYTYPTDIEKLDIIMYSPLEAKEFKIDPVATSTSESDYGEKLHFYQYTNVKKGESVKLNVSYEKKDNKSTLSAISAKQPPKDDTHTGVDGKTATDQVLNGEKAEQPIIGVAGASIIGVSIIIAALFVFFGLKGNVLSAKQPSANTNKKGNKKVTPQASKASNKDLTEEKKKLRAQLLNGKIDEETYERELKNLK
jgi:hypothetical protein